MNTEELEKQFREVFDSLYGVGVILYYLQQDLDIEQAVVAGVCSDVIFGIQNKIVKIEGEVKKKNNIKKTAEVVSFEDES